MSKKSAFVPRFLPLFFGVVLIATAIAGALAQQVGSATSRTRDDVIVAQGQGVLCGTYTLDLDASGTIQCTHFGNEADIWWDQIDSVHRQMAPIDGATLVNLGVVDFGSLTAVKLATTAGYGQTPIDGNADHTNQLTTGDVFAVHTNENNFSKVEILLYGYNLEIQWVTYAPPPKLSVDKTGNGRVTSTPAGIDCGTTCSAPFTNGTSVTLTPTPDPGWSFIVWSDRCTGGSCTVTLTRDVHVVANFQPTPRQLTVTKSGLGTGTITSSPAQLSCGTSCSATFPNGTSVTLSAAPDKGSTFAGWGDACSGTSTCTLTMDADKSVSATFSVAAPVFPTSSQPRSPSYPPATANPLDSTKVAAVSVGAEGYGEVTEGSGGRFLSAADDAAAPVSCGFNRFNCYTQLPPGQTVHLTAHPRPGYAFRAWTGSCAGQGIHCTVVARALQTVTALFVAQPAVATPGLEVNPIHVSVKWSKSVGVGSLLVTGLVGAHAQINVAVQRPGGGELVGRSVIGGPGPFHLKIPLRKGALLRGANVFPGGFVAVVTGKSGGVPLHRLFFRPVFVAPPREGVVRHAFATTVANGPATPRLPRGSTQAWAHFRLQTQPVSRLPVRVYWYWPKHGPMHGKLLGVDPKSNRPVIVSGIQELSGIPSGTWLAVLRAGPMPVKQLSVRVG
jgi:hypothetical protein